MLAQIISWVFVIKELSTCMEVHTKLVFALGLKSVILKDLKEGSSSIEGNVFIWSMFNPITGSFLIVRTEAPLFNSDIVDSGFLWWNFLSRKPTDLSRTIKVKNGCIWHVNAVLQCLNNSLKLQYLNTGCGYVILNQKEGTALSIRWLLVNKVFTRNVRPDVLKRVLQLTLSYVTIVMHSFITFCVLSIMNKLRRA